jgi:cytoskeleton protein RodZ
MSDQDLTPGAAPPPPESAAGSAERAGAMLRLAREQAGLHVEALAVALKVPAHKLQALEAGRIDLLPDPTFARALAATICRGLKIDPKPVLDLMPGLSGERMAVSPPAINARFEPTGVPSGGQGRRAKPSPAMWAVAVLLLGALAIYLWPNQEDAPESAGVTSSVVTPADVPAAVTEPVPAVEPVAPPAVPAPAASAPLATGAEPSVVPEASATPALLQFVAKAETWVQVTDAAGQVPLRRSLVLGETVAVGGTPPLAVVVGRIDAVDVSVRGQPYDLRAIAKNNVARFEVK